MKRDWVREIKKGDILCERRSGTLRVVRHVKNMGGSKLWIELSILRCSWTHRCHTTLAYHDIWARFEPTGHMWTLDTKIDKLLEQAIHQTQTNAAAPKLLDCCDVRGIT